MNLSDELETIAVGAPPPPAADDVIRLAGARRQRRLVAIPALLILVIVVPAGLFVVRGEFASSGPRRQYSFEMRGLPYGVAEIMQRRAEALGFDDPRVTLAEGYLTLEAGAVDEADLEAFAAPGRLQVRKVVRHSDMDQNSPSPPPASGTPATTAEAVKAKVGDFKDLRHPAFATLHPSEVALLPAWVQVESPLVRCDQLDATIRSPGRGEEFTTCAGGFAKMQLASAQVVGADVARVKAIVEPVTGQPMVTLELSRAARGWGIMVVQALTHDGCERNVTYCLVAFIVDGRVQSVPEIVAPSAQPGFHTPSGAKQDTARVAAIIGPNELPEGVTLRRL